MTHKTERSLFYRLRWIITSGIVLVGVCLHAQTTLEDLYEIAQLMNEEAVEAQQQVDQLDDARSSNLSRYESVLRSIDGQRVYNRQIQVLVNRQQDEIAKLEKSIEDVVSVKREITPLMLRMIEVLDQSVRHDIPFLLDERLNRISKLRELMNEPEISESEKFSQVLRAFQIESEYGRTMDASRGEKFDIDGKEFDVDILRVGRIALMYQTSDGKHTGWWDNDSRTWEPLPASYTPHIRNGLKIARKQLASRLFRVPIRVPEE